MAVTKEPSIRRALAVARASLHGEMPERYATFVWADDFNRRVRHHLRPGIRVLDVGGGRTPAIPIGERPDEIEYVGLDMSADELGLAAPGSYDEIIVSDIVDFQPALKDSFDLVVSFQVLEHVHSLEAALHSIHRYLTPHGVLVAQFSGKLSVFGMVSRAVPQWAIQKMINRLLKEESYKTFPAYYDRCWHRPLSALLSSWRTSDITPLFLGKGYFEFSRHLQAGYLAWEELAVARDWVNVAPYYLVEARP